jgi:hypothetical protein
MLRSNSSEQNNCRFSSDKFASERVLLDRVEVQEWRKSSAHNILLLTKSKHFVNPNTKFNKHQDIARKYTNFLKASIRFLLIFNRRILSRKNTRKSLQSSMERVTV